MDQALPQMPNQTFTNPDPVNESNPLLAGQYPIDNQIHSVLYYVDKNDPNGPPPANPASDPQYKNWEAAVQAWALVHPLTTIEAPIPPVSSSSPSVATTTTP